MGMAVVDAKASVVPWANDGYRLKDAVVALLAVPVGSFIFYAGLAGSAVLYGLLGAFGWVVLWLLVSSVLVGWSDRER